MYLIWRSDYRPEHLSVCKRRLQFLQLSHPMRSSLGGVGGTKQYQMRQVNEINETLSLKTPSLRLILTRSTCVHNKIQSKLNIYVGVKGLVLNGINISLCRWSSQYVLNENFLKGRCSCQMQLTAAYGNDGTNRQKCSVLNFSLI